METNRDVYSKLAKKLFAKDNVITKEDRDNSKKILFAALYGNIEAQETLTKVLTKCQKLQ